MPGKFYTNGEARKVLGNIHPNTLSSYVESGILTRVVPPGKKQGLYIKSEVDELAKKIQHFYEDEDQGKGFIYEQRFGVVNSP